MIELSKIRIDGGTQTREKLNQSTVKEYVESIKAGATFPPVTLFFDGSAYWLADGFHRYFATKNAGKKQIHEDITPGTLRDAVLHSLGANTAHGLPRSNKDKQRAVETLLNDPEWSAWSNRAIAEKCVVSHSYVNTLREKIKSGNVSTPANPEQSKPNTEDRQNEEATEAKLSAQEPEDPPKEPEYTALDEAQDRVSELQGALFVAAQGELPEEQKQAALSLVDSLRQEIKTKDATIKALTISRDGFQNQVAQLKKQCEMQRKEIAKLRAG